MFIVNYNNVKNVLKMFLTYTKNVQCVLKNVDMCWKKVDIKHWLKNVIIYLKNDKHV